MYEQTQFHTNCEMVWVKLEVAGVHPLYICAYYKPKEDDQGSPLELRRSIEKVKKHTKGNIWILGDFNLPKLLMTDNEASINQTALINRHMTHFWKYLMTLDLHKQ